MYIRAKETETEKKKLSSREFILIYDLIRFFWLFSSSSSCAFYYMVIFFLCSVGSVCFVDFFGFEKQKKNSTTSNQYTHPIPHSYMIMMMMCGALFLFGCFFLCNSRNIGIKYKVYCSFCLIAKDQNYWQIKLLYNYKCRSKNKQTNKWINRNYGSGSGRGIERKLILNVENIRYQITTFNLL